MNKKSLAIWGIVGFFVILISFILFIAYRGGFLFSSADVNQTKSTENQTYSKLCITGKIDGKKQQ